MGEHLLLLGADDGENMKDVALVRKINNLQNEHQMKIYSFP